MAGRQPPGCVQVQTTAASVEEAQRLATTLLEARLAACVQVLGPLASRYRWEGRMESATEWLCLAKTTEERLDEVIAAVRAAHSYETPEVIALPIVGGDDDYLAWIAASVAGGSSVG